MLDEGRRDVASTVWRSLPRDLLLVGLAVFCAALFGIMTRPMGAFAAFWPANALLLGLMLRAPHLSTLGGWFGAFAGFVAADLVTGGEPGMTIWLTAANLTEAITGYVLFKALPEGHVRLQRPQSVMVVFAVCCCAAAASAFLGAAAYSILIGGNFTDELELWFSTELVSTVTVLPVVLAAPKWRDIRWSSAAAAIAGGMRDAAPMLALLASVVLGSLLDGPGSFAFPVPALLWCALSYSFFATAVLTLVFAIWGMVAITGNLAELPPEIDPVEWGKSIRLGLALIALAPLAVGSVSAARNELVRRLKDMLEHDDLTRTLTRKTFIERSEHLLERLNDNNTGAAAVLMLDVDRFKSVNDRHGHAAGDAALVAFALSVSNALEGNGLFGRLGGEEFAVFLPGTTRAEAEAVAERIRNAVERCTVDLGSGVVLPITVSGGLALHAGSGRATLDAMLARADAALYRAKEQGRNCIVTAG
ncbi:GGDEF domain-containing protein [Mycoplana rhizolycopersici]|uniref:diguanylate cyclase n=1 Tax=Mycoplana rhizolycopersici TaxID=2746702 RepID=A0ABX2QCT1_9HYPH|nr:GGDEF domain-containing protein [Rhizobium rhizolycopersici]NVP55539.1 diguanylate cyclase [Rhizobium rhizolycopersici]